MNLESTRKFCKRLPHVTEDIKWGHDLCFLIGGRMFAVASLDKTEGHCLSFKCTPEEFAELVEVSGIIPAPYMARNHWVTMERFDALRDAEIEQFVIRSYEMVKAKLTRSQLASLGETSATKAKPGKGVKPLKKKVVKRTATTKK
ncbi:MAG TPA: MmcQ/YjbR family DNA-binding protein [Terriglobales bacterium]|nr:MmcQ/YjbR family DNA-binding protein [Terriglobales bacterium]